MKLLKRIALILFSAALIAALIIFLNIYRTAGSEEPRKSDVILVLGCQIWGRSTPSLSLQYRLEKALELYNKGYAGHIIVSGGQGKDEPVAEARLMKEWLVNRGINPDVISEEAQSTSTYENIKFSKAIMDKNSFRSAVIVSNDFHIFRSLKISRGMGIDSSGGPAPTVNYLKPYYYSREILSVVKHLLMDP